MNRLLKPCHEVRPETKARIRALADQFGLTPGEVIDRAVDKLDASIGDHVLPGGVVHGSSPSDVFGRYLDWSASQAAMGDALRLSWLRGGQS